MDNHVMTVLENARRYTRRGWSVIPVPHRSKNPGIDGWQQLRLAEGDLPAHFNGHPQNIGVLLGQPSGWLIDIDLDHQLAVALADQHFPPTPLVFGRKGKPRSHRLYRCTSPVATKKFRSTSAGMIVELRSSGAQTIFPPSTHKTGEPIRWEDEDAEPASIDPQELLDAVERLANAVRDELGVVTPEKPKRRQPSPPRERSTAASAPNAALPFDRCLAAILRMHLIDHHDGSSRLYAAACRAVEHDLDDTQALAVIREYAHQQPFPKDWSDDQVLRRVRDAEKVCRRGAAFEGNRDDKGLVALGNVEPATDRLVLSPKRTLPTATAYLQQFFTRPEGRTLHSHAGLMLVWRRNCYQEVEDEAIKKHLQAWLHEAQRYTFNVATRETELVPFDSNPATVKAALETIRNYVHLPATTTPPAWLGVVQRSPPHELLPCRSVLLHLPTMQLLPPTPALFVTNALEFDPNPHAPEPMAWHNFLHGIFNGDLESLELLQEWFGYCLTADTSQQKMMLIVGPRRSGKGTIARVLARLIGLANVCGPTTSGLAGNFGLQPLVGKTLAIVSDARFHGENISTVVERLLCISGEDTLTIDRKHLTSLTMKLSTRFMFLTNEFPRLNDASGALAGRFVILRLTESFYGKEDTGLTERLLGELPGILNWAIEGWRRLRERGRFVIPSSVQDVVQEIEDLSSPVSAFVRERCVVGPGHRVNVDPLYEAWKEWCGSEGRQAVATKQTFGRDLAAAVAGISRRRGTALQSFYEGIALKQV
jgi:putative DNA primase/helicase